MRISSSIQSQASQGYLIEIARISLFTLVLLISVVSSVAQKGFVNWGTLGPFYGVLCLAYVLHLIYFSNWNSYLKRPNGVFLSFVIDSLLISTLIFYSGINQSLFLFLHLVNILLAGILCRGVGAISLAFVTSISFSIAAVFSPEMRALNFFFLLALNNVAFFLVAGLAGYLSEQLESVGSELKKTDANLKSVQELNQFLVAHIPTGMVSFNDQGKVIQQNEAAMQILGANTSAELNWYTLFPMLKQQDSFRGDVRLQTEVPKTLGMTVNRVYSPEWGEHIGIALFEDLTKMRELEYNLRQSEKMAAVGGLAAGIAHEIRNPLAGISGSIEMLSQTVTNDDDRKLMKIVLREIDRLNNLITEFLDYSSPEVPPTDKVDLSSLLEEVMNGIKLNNQVRLDIEQKLSIPPKMEVLGRRDKLKQVFLNIVLNSYQAMNEKGTFVEIKIQAKDQNKIEVIIRDSGSGMSESTLKRMFEPFHTTKPKGTGLGLAVTHKILEGHGAKVFVESELGVGTVFTLTFPKAD